MVTDTITRKREQLYKTAWQMQWSAQENEYHGRDRATPIDVMVSHASLRNQNPRRQKTQVPADVRRRPAPG